MKILTLNIWGGKFKESLLNFLEVNSKDVDIFCFQESYSSANYEVYNGYYLNIFEQIAAVLPHHKGYFSPSFILEDPLRENRKIASGLSMFINSNMKMIKHGNITIYGVQTDIPTFDYKNAHRNLQYVKFWHNENEYLLSHFHGIWYPKTKVDTDDRLKQAKTINQFLNNFNGKKILCGDFNLLPDTKSMKIVEAGMRNLIKEYNIKTTRNSHYMRNEKFADYIILSPDIKITDFQVLSDIVSDHLPLLLEI